MRDFELGYRGTRFIATKAYRNPNLLDINNSDGYIFTLRKLQQNLKSVPSSYKTLLYKGVRFALDNIATPIVLRSRRAFLQAKYKHHAYEKTFDWDWSKISYNRIALVNLLTSKFPDCRYLEIGCEWNSLFHAVSAKTKTGVDPERGGNVRKTSDDFFRTNNEIFDVIFIDGLHTYDQVRRDVINSIKCLGPGGWIAMHDLLPRTWIEEHVPRIDP